MSAAFSTKAYPHPTGPATAATPAARKPIRVLIVDDSAVIRQLLARELARDPQITVVGTAPDPYVARERIVQLNPDVLTLDVEMPRMDGITFLRALTKHHPLPVIVLSSLTANGTRTAIDAMAAGAVDTLCKPNGSHTLESLAPLLIDKIKLAAQARIRPTSDRLAAPIAAPSTGPRPIGAAQPQAPRADLKPMAATDKIIALGASTGGVQALTEVISAFPPNAPGTVVVQHMPPNFTRSFADRLCQLSRVHVKEAESGDEVRCGVVLIAPGGYHMVLKHTGPRYHVEVRDGPEVHHQRPSVEVLFNSVAKVAGAGAVGAILTGMGADGAHGLLAMRQAGARTVAQDEASCVVFGMPAEAIKCGGAERILPLHEIAAAVLAMSQQSTDSSRSNTGLRA